MLLKKLTEASGVSGNEKEVRNFILNEIKAHIDEYRIDRLGNLIAIKKGKADYPSILLAAHMDEIGLMVKAIDDNGFIKFLPVGGIDDRILVSKVVEIGKDKIKGVIGAKAIHLQEPDERKRALKHKQLYIDIGAKTKAEAEKVVSIGDYITFASEYVEFGNNLIKAKALDDRAGCAILVDILKHQYNSTIMAVFTTQEEVGLRGAGVAAYHLNPDLALVLEGTICHDVTDIDEPYFSTRLGAGPALSIMDSTTYYFKAINNRLIETAKEQEIKLQFRQTTMGGNDAGTIHIAREGIPTATISVPCRYIHSPSSVMSKNDYEGCIKLVKAFLESVKKEEFIHE